MSKSLRIDLIRNKAEEYIPKGGCCWDLFGNNDIRCPFFQLRKMTQSRLNKLTKIIKDPHTNELIEFCFIPYGNHFLQYCSYLKKYLSIQDNIKDCGINEEYEEELVVINND